MLLQMRILDQSTKGIADLIVKAQLLVWVMSMLITVQRIEALVTVFGCTRIRTLGIICTYVCMYRDNKVGSRKKKKKITLL